MSCWCFCATWRIVCQRCVFFVIPFLSLLRPAKTTKHINPVSLHHLVGVNLSGAGILGNVEETHPEGLVESEKWSPPGQGSGERARPLSKNDFFALNDVGLFWWTLSSIFLKIGGQFVLASTHRPLQIEILGRFVPLFPMTYARAHTIQISLITYQKLGRNSDGSPSERMWNVFRCYLGSDQDVHPTLS